MKKTIKYPDINIKKTSKLGSKIIELQKEYEEYYDFLKLRNHSLYGKDRTQNNQEIERTEKNLIRIAQADLIYRKKKHIF
jgi:hypothetical protein